MAEQIPTVCVTEDGRYNYKECREDRVRCKMRNAPKGIRSMDAYDSMTGRLPDWCPLRRATEVPE